MRQRIVGSEDHIEIKRRKRREIPHVCNMELDLQTTRVRFTLETVPVTLSDRLMEGLGGRTWMKRKNQKAMHRLRGILEGSSSHTKDISPRVTVAGG